MITRAELKGVETSQSNGDVFVLYSRWRSEDTLTKSRKHHSRRNFTVVLISSFSSSSNSGMVGRGSQCGGGRIEEGEGI